ncbi:hypothetical protein [Natrinema ejinorense]|uniref:Uncharacterized protein n=1 Tax=Natrinema ejinorense TaxID=373386 RepID=A0A2A5QVS2_9EURY|nr:hypothetical protein [Natrinema ejinorense]PCR90948.1 hypothetical protein CP557_10690 [Natrinema ejinorense]
MPHENATADQDSGRPTAETGEQAPAPISAERTATIAATSTAAGADDADGELPNTLTIIGQGTPSSFEVTVEDDIELVDAAQAADVTVVSGTTIEGTIGTGTVEFRFAGDLTDVTFVDRGITGLAPTTTPNVHVDYDGPERSQT